MERQSTNSKGKGTVVPVHDEAPLDGDVWVSEVITPCLCKIGTRWLTAEK